MNNPNHNPSSVPLPRPSSRGWLWFFLLLALLSILATGTLIVYNLRQQLKPDQLEMARHVWREKGPHAYHLVYTIQVNHENRSDFYDVTVKNGTAIQALVNGLAEPADRLHYYGMEKLFSYIDTDLERDQKKGQPRTYTRAIFNPDTGALRWYVRRVMGGNHRVEITVEKLDK